MTRPGIERRALGPLSNTLPTRPMSWLYIYIYNQLIGLVGRVFANGPRALRSGVYDAEAYLVKGK